MTGYAEVVHGPTLNDAGQKSACGKLDAVSPEKRLSHSLTKYARDNEHPDEVKSLSPNHRFLIALLSPAQNRETGPPVCPAEKVKAVNARKQ